MKKSIEVVAAIIKNKRNEIFCVQRDKSIYDYISYKWEFPGGKIEKNESQVRALERELKEELDISITIEPDSFFGTYEYSYEHFNLKMHAFNLTLDDVEKESLKLNDHINHKWLHPEKLDTLNWAAADIPIVDHLREQI